MEILRTRAVARMVGLSLPTIWRMRRVGAFPSPIRLGENSVGWLESDIVAWIESRRTVPAAKPAA